MQELGNDSISKILKAAKQELRRSFFFKKSVKVLIILDKSQIVTTKVFHKCLNARNKKSTRL